MAGLVEFNHHQFAAPRRPDLALAYVTSSEFAVDVAENWQSEYLQFMLYIFGTVWLFQRGSPESKPLDKAGTESDEDQKVGAHAGRARRAGRAPAACERRSTPTRW